MEKEKVTFAVTGRSATGKSTFINKIRDIKPSDQGYAKSGTGDTTKEPTPYQNPQNERIVFYDLPGKRLRFASGAAAAISATPLIGLDVTANIAIIVEEVIHYIIVFGLDENTLNNLGECDRNQLKSASFLVSGVDIFKVVMSKLGKYVAILAAESAADLVLPILGSIISAGTSAIFTYRYLSHTLDDFRDDACLVYKVILEKQRSKSENI
ncbi:unnamed protein product [Mytilus edulis]|uniref:IRG-type G domain-containing protein n=1 Tax=Mytilus edulis TaxID=6550 RepID=A0A8S3UQ82_MYTED|nr:unnamed protein product [Mytilus edulis]